MIFILSFQLLGIQYYPSPDNAMLNITQKLYNQTKACGMSFMVQVIEMNFPFSNPEFTSQDKALYQTAGQQAQMTKTAGMNNAFQFIQEVPWDNGYFPFNSNATQAATEIFDNMSSFGGFNLSGSLFFMVDTEICGYIYNNQYCHCISNITWYEQFTQKMSSLGVNVGIFSDSQSWNYCSNNANSMSQLPLMYQDVDGQANFDDYVAFGGWTVPTMKTYLDNQPTGCPQFNSCMGSYME